MIIYVSPSAAFATIIPIQTQDCVHMGSRWIGEVFRSQVQLNMNYVSVADTRMSILHTRVQFISDHRQFTDLLMKNQDKVSNSQLVNLKVSQQEL